MFNLNKLSHNHPIHHMLRPTNEIAPDKETKVCT